MKPDEGSAGPAAGTQRVLRDGDTLLPALQSGVGGSPSHRRCGWRNSGFLFAFGGAQGGLLKGCKLSPKTVTMPRL